MTVWRLHLRPKNLDPRGVVRHCVDNRLLGLGWGNRVEPVKGESSQDYLRRHREAYGRRESSVHLMIEAVKPNDFIWARDENGRYLLGHVASAPYARTGDWVELQDMFHVAPVQLLGDGRAVLDDTEVPGRVKSSFGGRGQALQRINDGFAVAYTHWLFASKTSSDVVLPPRSPFIDLLDPYELEDLVLLFLQEKGWRVLLSSHSRSTPRFECTLLHPDAGTAGVQVKHRGADLDAGDYAEDAQVGTVFLFAASGAYGEEQPANVRTIDLDALVAFARQRRTMLPTSLRLWFDLSEEGREGA